VPTKRGPLAPINDVHANSGARVLSALALPARPAQGRARYWLARAATAIREFPDGASWPPDARCIRDRRAEPIGTFDAYVHPIAHKDDPPLSFSLNMDDDAPSVMGSPELEDRYTFVIENASRAAACDLEMAAVGSPSSGSHARSDAQRPSALPHHEWRQLLKPFMEN